MKTYNKLLILITTIVFSAMIIGCNKPTAETETTIPSATAKTEISDADVTMKVKAALLKDENSKSFGINVVTLKGDVRLTGVVDNQSQLDQIDKLVRSVEGVHSIHDELTIKK